MNCTHGIDTTTTRCVHCDLITITAENERLCNEIHKANVLLREAGEKEDTITTERDKLKASEFVFLAEKETPRAKIFAALQKEMEEQLFLAAETGHLGIARFGGDRRKMVELQMEWLRNCAQSWQNPAAFLLNWLRMMVSGLLVCENLVDMQNAVKDATETNTDKQNET